MEIEFEKLVEIIADEVLNQLNRNRTNVYSSMKEEKTECSCKTLKFNPSCCSVTELSRAYIFSIKAEVSNIMAL